MKKETYFWNTGELDDSFDEPDRQYLSRLTLDPTAEYGWENLDGFDLSYSYDDETDAYDDQNIADAEDSILEDDFLFEN